MKTQDEIKKKIKEIEDDDRYQSGKRQPARSDINAPLAVAQLVLETQIATLWWVLSEEDGEL